MPLQRWKKKENVQPNTRRSPSHERIQPCTVEYACGPAAAASSQKTSSGAPTLRAIPVTRWLIDRTEVSCGL